MTLHQCHTVCREKDNCNWYSHGENICLIFETCTAINSQRTNYTTQHSTCPQLKDDHAGSYEERYKSHLESSSSQWVQYITKEVPGDVTRIDCGLYCEEYEPCDFFLQNDNCYLGTFQTNVSESGFTLEEQIRRITVYTVHKATHELTIAKEQFQAPVQYPYDLIKVFAYNAFDLSVLEHCPIFCLLQPRCHFYFTVEGQSVNCVIGLFAPTPSRSRIDMNLTQDVALVPIKGIDPANLLADGMGRGRTFGSCTGAGFHHVNGTDWKLRFNLRYNNGMNCYFVIYNYPLNAKLRMTVNRFNVSHYHN